MMRLTETSKWSDPLFYALPGPLKLAWLYILENCDKTGFWLPEFEVLNSRITPLQVTKAECLNAFSAWIKVHATGVWQIRDWFPFQYPKMNHVRSARIKELTTLERVLGHEVFSIAGLESPVRQNGAADTGPRPGAPGSGPPEEGDEAEAGAEAEVVEAPQEGGIGEPEGQGGRVSTTPRDLQAEDVFMASITNVAKGLGYPVSRVAPYTRVNLCLAFAQSGAKCVEDALRLYDAGFKGDRSLGNFADHVERWIHKVPPDPTRCTHEFKERITDLDPYANGSKSRALVCRCGATKGAASVFQPPCAHEWVVFDFKDNAFARAHNVPPQEQCKLCNASRPLQGARP